MEKTKKLWILLIVSIVAVITVFLVAKFVQNGCKIG